MIVQLLHKNTVFAINTLPSKINSWRETLQLSVSSKTVSWSVAFYFRTSICSCGWLSDKTARYPMAEAHPACGGAATVHTCNWRSTWNAYCYMGNLRLCAV